MRRSGRSIVRQIGVHSRDPDDPMDGGGSYFVELAYGMGASNVWFIPDVAEGKFREPRTDRPSLSVHVRTRRCTLVE